MIFFSAQSIQFGLSSHAALITKKNVTKFLRSQLWMKPLGMCLNRKVPPSLLLIPAISAKEQKMDVTRGLASAKTRFRILLFSSMTNFKKFSSLIFLERLPYLSETIVLTSSNLSLFSGSMSSFQKLVTSLVNSD